jgi:predicted metal-dependent hydrolase
MSGPPAADRAAAVSSFLASLASGAYVEAHEVLEAFWVGYGGSDRDFYRGLIQAAVALHHAHAGNAAGAASVAARARGNLAPYAPRHAGVDVDAVLARLERT